MAAEVQSLAFAADEFFGVNERWPSHMELLQLDSTLPKRDLWEHEFTFGFTASGAFEVRSPGMDGRLHTADDIVSWPMRGGERYQERQRHADERSLRG